jgi:hypothetical protein
MKLFRLSLFLSLCCISCAINNLSESHTSGPLWELEITLIPGYFPYNLPLYGPEFSPSHDGYGHAGFGTGYSKPVTVRYQLRDTARAREIENELLATGMVQRIIIHQQK